MYINNSSNHHSISRFVYWVLGIKCGFDLYHDVKLFGFNEDAIMNAIFLICLIFLYIMDIVYDRKGRDIPKVIMMIILGILLSAFTVYSYRDVRRFGFNYGTIVYIACIIYLIIWYIIALAYNKKGRDIPMVIKIIPLVIFLSVVIVTLILSTIDRYKALTVFYPLIEPFVVQTYV
jgi:membrane-associated HD superfamily phosphohydrolase